MYNRFLKETASRVVVSNDSDAIRRRRGGWFLARETDVAKARNASLESYKPF